MALDFPNSLHPNLDRGAWQANRLTLPRELVALVNLYV